MNVTVKFEVVAFTKIKNSFQAHLAPINENEFISKQITINSLTDNEIELGDTIVVNFKK